MALASFAFLLLWAMWPSCRFGERGETPHGIAIMNVPEPVASANPPALAHAPTALVVRTAKPHTRAPLNGPFVMSPLFTLMTWPSSRMALQLSSAQFEFWPAEYTIVFVPLMSVTCEQDAIMSRLKSQRIITLFWATAQPGENVTLPVQ